MEEKSYSEKRAKNNEAVKKSRAKSKMHIQEVSKKLAQLQSENEELIEILSLMNKERSLLKRFFLEHAGHSHGLKLTHEQMQLLQEEPTDVKELEALIHS